MDIIPKIDSNPSLSIQLANALILKFRYKDSLTLLNRDDMLTEIKLNTTITISNIIYLYILFIT